MRGSPRVASLCCDAPVKTPLTPLHLFIKTLGPLPPTQALTTYINRLRENGFNMWKTVQKAIDCGANVDSEISRVVRINVRSPFSTCKPATRLCRALLARVSPSVHGGVATARWHMERFDRTVGVQGGTKEKEKVGHLVWAPVAQGGKDAVMWPAEALDAAALPQGRTIPREALASLNLTERNLVQQAIDSSPRACSIFIVDSKLDLLLVGRASVMHAPGSLGSHTMLCEK